MLTEHVDFKKPYSSAPDVVVSTNTMRPDAFWSGVSNVTASGFDVNMYSTSAWGTVRVYWIAIGS